MNDIEKGIYKTQLEPGSAKLNPDVQYEVDYTKVSLSEVLN